jgi:hypothetical protein
MLANNRSNIWLLGAYVEKGISKRLFIKAEGNDLFNQSPLNFNRITRDNYITDYRFNTIGRNVLMSLIYKINRFGNITR